ncbi:MAG: hypothetical protein AB7F79_05100 [Steroidobacteraceae bacterium]
MNKTNTLTIVTICSLLTGMAATISLAADEPASLLATKASMSADAMTNMQKMKAQMAAIHTTKDANERAKLMNEHMETMQHTMQMMQQNMGGMGKGMPMQGMGSDNHMNMMQMMLEQMAEHQKAMQSSGQ